MKNTTRFIAILSLIFLLPLGIKAQLSGAYDIDSRVSTGGRNFQSFADFTSALSSQGVSSAVTVDVVSGSGPYNEQVVFTTYAGASANNEIIINGNGEIVSFSPTSADRRVIGFDSASHITIDSLVVESASSNYGYGIHLMNNSDSVSILNCTIDMTSITNPAADQSAGIVISGSDHQISVEGSVDYLEIRNNQIMGGAIGGVFTGIHLNSISDNFGNKIINNIITNFNHSGIIVNNQANMIISKNDLSRPTIQNSYNTGAFGIILKGNLDSCIVDGNSLHDFWTSSSFGGTITGIYNYKTKALPSTPTIIKNNLIYEMNFDGYFYALHCELSRDVKYYNNTISLDDTATNTNGITVGFWVKDGNKRIAFKNNIISITRGGPGDKYGVRFNNATPAEMDYNTIYMHSKGGGFENYAFMNYYYETWAEFKNSNGRIYEQNSIAVDPDFVSTSDLTPQNHLLNGSGDSVGVAKDFNDSLRGVKPDIGAIEFDSTGYPYYPIAMLNTEVGNGIADSMHILCFTSGTVMGINMEDYKNNSYYVSDHSTGFQEGLYITSYDSLPNFALSEGDSVKVFGKICQVDGLTKMDVYSVEVLKAGGKLPTPQVVNEPTEATEGKLIEIEDLVVTGGYYYLDQSIIAQKGNKTIELHISDNSDMRDSAWVFDFLVGDTICSVIGVGGQEDDTAPYTSDYVIIPMRMSSIDTINCRTTVGIKSLNEKAMFFEGYPNPTSGNFYIRAKGFDNDRIEIEILDINGKVIFQKIAYGTQAYNQEFDLSDYPKGIYLLKIADGTKIYKKKVFKF